MTNIPQKQTWRRPDLDDGREVPRQKDLVELFRPDGERFGLMEVDNYPLVAVTRCMYFTEKSFEKQYSVSNVPPTLGIVCAEGKGELVWKNHGHEFGLSNGSCTLVNLHRPDDGHSILFLDHTDCNGVIGYEVTGPNGHSIFLPAGGFRYDSGLDSAGDNGFYWSATSDVEEGASFTLYFFNPYGRQVYSATRRYGFSVRPVSK